MATIAPPVVRPRFLQFTPSTSPDVRDHYLVHVVGDGVLSHDANPRPVGVFETDDGTIRVPLAELYEFPDNARVSFAVYAEDNAGNKSALWQAPAWVDVPLDFTPPQPPSGGSLD